MCKREKARERLGQARMKKESMKNNLRGTILFKISFTRSITTDLKNKHPGLKKSVAKAKKKKLRREGRGEASEMT